MLESEAARFFQHSLHPVVNSADREIAIALLRIRFPLNSPTLSNLSLRLL